jgi:surface carbohydrate biosynthesis protein
LSYLQACYIRVEVKKRELVSRIDLAIEMVKRGVPVILGECYNPKELIKLGIKKGYFFGKCAQPATLKKFKLLLDYGWIFGALDEEGLLPDSLETFASQRFSMESAKTFKDVFFFGNKQKEAFDKIFSPRKSFIVSGNPRTDMWKSNYYGLHDESIQDIKKKYGRFILFPLNFRYYTVGWLHYMSTHGDLKSTNKILAEKSEFLFDKFCKLAEKLAKETKTNIIMRPHPGEDVKTVRKLMTKHGVKSNFVHCIGTNEAFPWIAAAQILFHNCCATSLEAAFCGTPVVTYAPSKTSFYKEDDINNFFPIVQSYEEALNVFVQSEKNNINLSNFYSCLKQWGGLSLEQDGKSSNFIADRIIQRNNFDLFQKKTNNYSRQIDTTRLKYELMAYLSSLAGNNDRKVLLNKFPRTSIEEIKNIVDHICRYRGYKNSPNITSINSRLFTLSPSVIK